ncbi:permease [Escherichia coli]
MLQDAAEMFVFLAVELSLLFIVISAGVSLIRQKVQDHKIQQMMGGQKRERLSPGCSVGSRYPCSVVARQYPCYVDCCQRKSGLVRLSLFLFVSPLLNPIIVGLMWMTFGWKVTLLYAIIAAGVSVLASIILDSLGV